MNDFEKFSILEACVPGAVRKELRKICTKAEHHEEYSVSLRRSEFFYLVQFEKFHEGKLSRADRDDMQLAISIAWHQFQRDAQNVAALPDGFET